jgi:hypothetical protein
MKITKEYSPSDILDIIRAHEVSNGNTPGNMQFLMEEVCEGYGMQEKYVTRFTGIKVEVEG